MRFPVLWLLACLAMPAQAGDKNLQACLSLAEQRIDRALNLSQDCPLLYDDLKNQGLLNSVEPPLTAEVSVAQLVFLADSRLNMRPTGLIDRDGLDGLLADILTAETGDPESAWWQAVLEWLDSLQPAEYEAEYQWLMHWLKGMKPSERTALMLLYGSILLLSAASAWLVLREFYQAGFFRNLYGRQRPVLQAATRPQTSRPALLHPFGDLPPQQQMAALLAQLVQALAERRLIPLDPSLTHRQLLADLGRQPGLPNRELAHLVYRAEPVLFGNRTLDSDALGQYRLEVQALLDKLVS